MSKKLSKMIKHLFSIISIIIIITYFFITITDCKDTPIISFNVYERDDSFGQYFANLLIPSLNISTESNISLSDDNYKINIKVDKPIELQLSGDVKVITSDQSMDKKFDISLSSNTLPHLNTRSHVSITRQSDTETLVLTNISLKDNINNMSATYECTLFKRTTCPEITLHHNLTTSPESLLYFSSNVTEVCDPQTDSSQMAINISMSSQVWQMANTQLRQIFNFGKNKGSETMNASHPLMDISVVADWDRTTQLIHFKKAVFSSKFTDFIPSFDIIFKQYKDIPNQLIVNILKDVPNILQDIRDEL